MGCYTVDDASSLLSVNLCMIPSKIAFFLYGGLLGSHVPFLTVFFVSVGLSTSQAGFINGMRFVSVTLSCPLWGLIADYSKRRRLILILLCIGSAVPIFSLPFVSSVITPLVSNSSGMILSSNITTPQHTIFTTHFGGPERTSVNVLFYVLLAITMFGSIFVGPLPAFIDSIVMEVVKIGDDGASYGAQRIFGSIGFSVASLICGIAADHFKVPHLSQYTAVFCIYLPYTLLLIPFVYHLVGQARWEYNEVPEQKQKLTHEGQERRRTMTSQFIYLFRQFDVFLFMVTVFISGLACNLYQNFASLLVKDVLRATETEMGSVFVIATVSEVVVFPFTSRIIETLGGTSLAMTLGLFSYFIRYLVMSYTSKLWLMLLVQSLHALGFALTWAAMMEYIHEISPKEVKITMFLIFQSIHFGVASILANILGGICYQAYGGRLLFRGIAVVCGIWSFMMLIYNVKKYLRKRCMKNGYIPIDSNGKYRRI